MLIGPTLGHGAPLFHWGVRPTKVYLPAGSALEKRPLSTATRNCRRPESVAVIVPPTGVSAAPAGPPTMYIVPRTGSNAAGVVVVGVLWRLPELQAAVTTTRKATAAGRAFIMEPSTLVASNRFPVSLLHRKIAVQVSVPQRHANVRQ